MLHASCDVYVYPPAAEERERRERRERRDKRDLYHEIQQSSGEDKEEAPGAAGVLLDGCPKSPSTTLL